MNKSKKSDTDQQQFWQMVFDTFKSSGLSVRQFCRQEGLPEPSFYSWRKKLNTNDVPANEKYEDCQLQPFIEISMPHEKPDFMELILASGNTLRINSGADNKTLLNVLLALCKAGLC